MFRRNNWIWLKGLVCKAFSVTSNQTRWFNKRLFSSTGLSLGLKVTNWYSQMHRTDKYSQHSKIIWQIWLNGWVFVYELSACGFKVQISLLPLFDKKQMKNILQRDSRKRDVKIQHKYLSRCSLKYNSEKSWEWRWRTEEKKSMYMFKAKEGKQLQNNGTENLFVVIIYLIETSKMSLLSIAESLKSSKRSNLTFKRLGKFFKDEINAWYIDEEGNRAFSKLRKRRKKCSLFSTSKLQLHKGFKVSRKPCLNLCSFK